MMLPTLVIAGRRRIGWLLSVSMVCGCQSVPITPPKPGAIAKTPVSVAALECGPGGAGTILYGRIVTGTPRPALKMSPLPARLPNMWRAALVQPPPGAALDPFSKAERGVILGPGDVVTLRVLGQPELGTTVDVNGDGSIQVPLAGNVTVAGLSTSAAAARVAQALRHGGFILDPQVTLATSDSRSQQVSVLGEVRQPGRFQVGSRITALDALALAGGVSESGGSVAYVLRPEGGNTVRHELDLDAVTGGAAFRPFEIRAGDTLVVPKAEQFYIYGEVKSPNAYRLKPRMSVIQALSVAGGLTDRGSDRRVEIRRRDASGQLRTLAVDLSDAILPGDIIYVKERFF